MKSVKKIKTANRNKAKNSIKTPAFWTGIITTVVVAAAAEFGLSLEETSVAGVVTAVCTFLATKFMQNKHHLKQGEKRND